MQTIGQLCGEASGLPYTGLWLVAAGRPSSICAVVLVAGNLGPLSVNLATLDGRAVDVVAALPWLHRLVERQLAALCRRSSGRLCDEPRR